MSVTSMHRRRVSGRLATATLEVPIHVTVGREDLYPSLPK
jgi:hypothetical protein